LCDNIDQAQLGIHFISHAEQAAIQLLMDVSVMRLQELFRVRWPATIKVIISLHKFFDKKNSCLQPMRLLQAILHAKAFVAAGSIVLTHGSLDEATEQLAYSELPTG